MLKKIAKVVGYIVLSLVVLGGAAIAVLYVKNPAQRPASDSKIQVTPARLARGEYLWHVGDCDGCHSPHDEKNIRIAAESSRAGKYGPD